MNDLKFALRPLLKNSGFTAVVYLCRALACAQRASRHRQAVLPLGIGADADIFHLVNAVLLNLLPYAESERLVALWEVRKDGTRGSVSYPNFLGWRTENCVFDHIAVNRESTLAFTGGREPANLRTVIATPELICQKK